MRIAVFTIAGLLFAWLVLFKIVNRLLRRFGYVRPCPHQFGWLLDLRPARFRRTTMLDRIGLHSATRVLEIGSGVGTFTAEAAKRIGPSGNLIAVDVQPEMVTKLTARLTQTKVANVWPLVADACNLPLQDQSVDRVLAIGVLPEIPDRHRALTEVRRVLRPSGMLSIIEDFLDPDYPFPTETVQVVEAAGFRAVRRSGSFLLYTIHFRRSDHGE